MQVMREVRGKQEEEKMSCGLVCGISFGRINVFQKGPLAVKSCVKIYIVFFYENTKATSLGSD